MNNTKWPYQKRNTGSKNLKFCIECLEAAENMSSELSNISDKTEIYENEQLINGKLDSSRLEGIVNPLGLNVATFKPPTQSYPLLRDKIDLLIGEEWKRKFDFAARLVNPEAIRNKLKKKAQIAYNMLAKMITEDIGLEDSVKKKKLQKLQKSMKSWKDIREKRANRILDMEYRRQNMKELFNSGMRNMIVKRNSIYAVDIVNGRTETRLVDWENIKAVRTGNSKKLDNADIIVEETYESPGWVIDRFYKNLTQAEISKIDKGDFSGENSETSFGNKIAGDLLTFDSDGFGSSSYSVKEGSALSNEIVNLSDVGSSNSGYVDQYGNIRVTRLVWRSLRKLGEIEWVDESGNKQLRVVDENYKPRKELGEKVSWRWVTEYWRIVRIGKDIYPEYGPRPVQYRQVDNITSAGSGYIGNVLDVCPVDLMKPFQILYDVLMERTKHAFMTSRGKVAVMDMSRKPKKMSQHQWYHYLDVMNTLYEDSFSEGARGAAMGKIAGNMQQSNRSIDLENGQYIQQHILMLQYIEQRIGDIAGIPKAREGQSSSTETATGIQNSVTQSYHITEPYFALQENIKNRVLEAVLESTKYCIRQDPDLYEYYLDEEDLLVDKLDTEEFLESSLGIDVTSSGEDMNLLNQYKQLAHAAIQNDKMKLSVLATIYESKSVTDIRNRIESSEEEAEERAIQTAEMEQEMIKRQSAKEEAKWKEELASKERMNMEDNKTDIMEKLIDLDMKKLDADNKSDEIFAKIEDNYNRYFKELEDKKQDSAFKEKELNLKEQDLKEKYKQRKQGAQ